MTEKNEEGDYPALVDIENKDPKFVHFYVQHFESVIKETEVRYADLFPEQSKVVKAWDALTYPAKQIYIRLYCRKPLWFSKNGLDERYTEIENLSSKAIPELIDKGFLISSANILKPSQTNSPANRKSLSQLLYFVLNKSELENIVKRSHIDYDGTEKLTGKRKKGSKTKLQLAEMIASNYYIINTPSQNKPESNINGSKTDKKPIRRCASLSPAAPLRQKTLFSFFGGPKASVQPTEGGEIKDPFKDLLLPSLISRTIKQECIALSEWSSNAFKIFQHLFFLSPWQSMNLMTIANIGRIRYPAYNFHISYTPNELLVSNQIKNELGSCIPNRIFFSKKQFEDYQHALFLEMELHYAMKKLSPKSSYTATNASHGGSSPFFNPMEEIMPIDILDDSFFLRYNYDWQCHLDPSPLHTLIRVIHHSSIILFERAFSREIDPFRTVSEYPDISEQFQSVINAQNQMLAAPVDNTQVPRSKSQPTTFFSQEPLEITKNSKNVKRKQVQQDKTEISSPETLRVPDAPLKIQNHIEIINGENQQEIKIEGRISVKMEELNPQEKISENNGEMLWMDRFRSEWVYSRIITHALKELEKQKQYLFCVCFYRLLLGCKRWSYHRRGQWWERLALILHSHLKKPNYALSIALLGLSDPLIPEHCPERLSLIKRVQRLHKPPLKWGPAPEFPTILEAQSRTFIGELVSSGTGKKNLWKSILPPEKLAQAITEEESDSEDLEIIENSAKIQVSYPVDNDVQILFEFHPSELVDDEDAGNKQQIDPEDVEDKENAKPKQSEQQTIKTVTVEDLALQFYANDGWEGFHCEGGVVFTLFSLFMYDILFADIPFVFQTKFQDAPLDLLSPDFYENRKDFIVGWLAILSDASGEQLAQMLEDIWNKHEGESIKSVDWKRRTLFLLQTICICFGGKRLASLFEIIALDYKASRSGMPDLLLWKQESNTVTGEMKSDILFSEVKGPTDKLSTKQYLWIHKLLSKDIPVELCYIRTK